MEKLAEKEFGRSISKDELGIYEPREHFDNPNRYKLVSKKPLEDSFIYIESQLFKAASSGNTSVGRMYFGNALHVVQDFFSHSNYVQIISQLRRGLKSSKKIKVGVFGNEDKVVSIMEFVIGFVKENINYSQFALTELGKYKAWMNRHIGTNFEITSDDYYMLDPRHQPANKSWFKALDVLQPLLEKARLKAKQATKKTTHSEIHQDDPARPHFVVAHKLAIYVTRELAYLMKGVWNSKIPLPRLMKLVRFRLRKPVHKGWWRAVVR